MQKIPKGYKADDAFKSKKKEKEKEKNRFALNKFYEINRI